MDNFQQITKEKKITLAKVALMKMWKTKETRALLLAEALKMRKKEARIVSKKQTQSAKKDFQDKRESDKRNYDDKRDSDKKTFNDMRDSDKRDYEDKRDSDKEEFKEKESSMKEQTWLRKD